METLYCLHRTEKIIKKKKSAEFPKLVGEIGCVRMSVSIFECEDELAVDLKITRKFIKQTQNI